VEDLYAELQNLVEPALGLGLLSGMAGGVDLSAYPLDGPLPALPESNAMKSRQALFIELARRENLTIRQLYLKIVGARGHCTLVGTPLQVADHLEEWFREGRRTASTSAAAAAGGTGFRRSGGAGVAAARPVPPRVRRPHAAREPRTGTPGACSAKRLNAAVRPGKGVYGHSPSVKPLHPLTFRQRVR
jgi:hypothetical protein